MIDHPHLSQVHGKSMWSKPSNCDLELPSRPPKDEGDEGARAGCNWWLSGLSKAPRTASNLIMASNLLAMVFNLLAMACFTSDGHQPTSGASKYFLQMGQLVEIRMEMTSLRVMVRARCSQSIMF